MDNYTARVKRFFRFGKKEINDILISILVITFVFAFDDPNETFEIVLWIGNFIAVLILVAISFLAHQSVQKLVSLFAGYRSEYKAWGWGIIIAFIHLE